MSVARKSGASFQLALLSKSQVENLRHFKSDGHRRPLQQLEFIFRATQERTPSGRDFALEEKARQLLRSLGAATLAAKVHVEWNTRMRSAAGRADSRHALISLNPRLRQHSASEVEQTLRHELAHLLAQARAGRRRIAPHGAEWRLACRDLGIGGEARCHTLPFPVARRVRRFLYKCPHCRTSFPRVHRIRRAVACLACCRAYNHGDFDARYRLRLVEAK